MEWHTLVAVGGFIGLVGAAMIAYGTWRSSQENDALNRTIAAAAQENATLSRSLAAKSEQIADLSSRIMASVTGGDSFVYLEAMYPDTTGPVLRPATLAYFVRQWGDHPTFDVVIRIRQETPSGMVAVSDPQVMPGPVIRGRGLDWTIPQNGRSWPLVFDEPPRPEVPGTAIPPQAKTYQVEMSTRTGVVVQTLHVTPVGQRWHTESRTLVRLGVGPLKLPDDFSEAQDYHKAK